MVAELTRRVERLEAALAASDGSSPAQSGAVPPPPPPPPRRSADGPAAAGRARLAEAKASPPPPPSLRATGDPSSGDSAPAVAEAAADENAAPASDAPTASAGAVPTRDELALAWGDDLLDRMSRKGRARFAAGRFAAVEDGTAVMALPNEPHRKRCEDLRGELEAVLAARFGAPVPVRLVVDDGSVPDEAPTAPATTGASPTAEPQADDEVDLTDLVDADAAEGSAVDAVARAFPGATLVDPD